MDRVQGGQSVPLLETERQEDLHEIEEDKDRAACEKLQALCKEMSERLAAYVGEDPEFNSHVQALQGALTEYEALRGRRFRARRAYKQVQKWRQELSVYCCYNEVNLLLLQSPRAYACMLCQNKQLVQTEDGEEICAYAQGDEE